MNDRFRKPVEQGDEIEVTIESTGAKGDGIAKVNNFVVIVPGVGESSGKSEESYSESEEEAESNEESSDEEALEEDEEEQ